MKAGTHEELARQAADCQDCMDDIRQNSGTLHLQAASMNSELCQLKHEVSEGFEKLEARQAKLEVDMNARFEKQATEISEIKEILQQLLDR